MIDFIAHTYILYLNAVIYKYSSRLLTPFSLRILLQWVHAFQSLHRAVKYNPTQNYLMYAVVVRWSSNTPTWTGKMVKTTVKNATPSQKVKKLLHSLFYDITKPSAYTGKQNVFKAARRALSSVKRSDIDRWFEDQLTHTLHRPTRVRFIRNKTVVKSIDDQWQADLCALQSKLRAKAGNIFILTCNDCFSKYA